MDELIGVIKLFAGNFAPRGFALCQGQILSIAQNTALFSILGTTYGGNGQTTFALPDLRGRAPNGQGQGPGLSSYDLGQSAGTETVTLLSNQMAPHIHGVLANGESNTTGKPANNFPATNGAYNTANDGTVMNPAMITPNAGGQPVPILNPYLTLNFIICIEGIYPSRN